jgi:hypothetical protein
VTEPVLAQLRWFWLHAAVDMNRAAHCPEFQLIPDVNATAVNDGLRQGDLKLPGYFGHQPILRQIKDAVKELSLISTPRLDARVLLKPFREGGFPYPWLHAPALSERRSGS